MARLIKAAEANDTRRRVYFHIVQTDGLTPSILEEDRQPQISIDGGDFTDNGIGTLVAIGSGRYYATLSETILVAGRHIETRYSSLRTAEIPGDSVDVVAFDPYNSADLGVADIELLPGIWQQVKNPKDIAILPGSRNSVHVTTSTGQGGETGVSITTGVGRGQRGDISISTGQNTASHSGITITTGVEQS